MQISGVKMKFGLVTVRDAEGKIERFKQGQDKDAAFYMPAKGGNVVTLPIDQDTYVSQEPDPDNPQRQLDVLNIMGLGIPLPEEALFNTADEARRIGRILSQVEPHSEDEDDGFSEQAEEVRQPVYH